MRLTVTNLSGNAFATFDLKSFNTIHSMAAEESCQENALNPAWICPLTPMNFSTYTYTTTPNLYRSEWPIHAMTILNIRFKVNIV